MSNILVASDYVVIPTETRILSVNGVTKTIERIQEFQESISLGILGIVPTRHVSRQVECQENLKELQTLYGDLVWSAIAERTPWSESPSFAKSIFAYAPRTHKAVKEASMFVGSFIQAMQAQGVY
jgi:chromosome partitioning protein